MSTISKKFDLIIFDCDGTLVDSEVLNNAVTADVLTDYGLQRYTTEYCIDSFAGKSWTEIKKLIDEKEQIDLPQYVIQTYIDTVQARMEKELTLVNGAYDFVKASNDNHKICIGSNGERGNVLKSLSITGLNQYFPEHKVFTKIQVQNAKPAPDLFLYAAKQMQVDPSRCLVIEDSVSGARAGVAAEMSVIGFNGVSHNKKESEKMLKEVGVGAVFSDFIHIGEYLGY